MVRRAPSPSRHGACRRAVAVPLLAAAVVLGGAACSSDSTTRVLTEDPSDVGPSGPRPTAPGAGGTSGTARPGRASATGANPALNGTVDIPELVRRLDALQGEDDACTLLTGEALADVTGADINLSSLLRDPSGFTQLFAGLQRTYVHLVDIAPTEIDPPLSVLGNLWATLARLDPRSPQAQSAVADAVGAPQVRAANDTVAAWITANCGGGR